MLRQKADQCDFGILTVFSHGMNPNAEDAQIYEYQYNYDICSSRHREMIGLLSLTWCLIKHNFAFKSEWCERMHGKFCYGQWTLTCSHAFWGIAIISQLERVLLSNSSENNSYIADVVWHFCLLITISCSMLRCWTRFRNDTSNNLFVHIKNFHQVYFSFKPIMSFESQVHASLIM